MTSRSFSLTALSCVLATAGTGCSRSLSETSQNLEELVNQRLQAAKEDAATAENRSMRVTIDSELSPQAQIQNIRYRRPEMLPPQLSQEPFSQEPFLRGQQAQPKGESQSNRHQPQVRQPFSPQRSRAEQDARQQKYWSAGIDAGFEASIGEQSAITDTDWNQVVSQWKTAIASLSRISPENPRYGDAQSKLAIYRTGLSRAEGQYIAVVQNRYAALNTTEKPQNEAVQPVVNRPEVNRRRTFEEDGDQIRQWIETGNFAAAEQLLTQAVQSKRLTRNGLDYADAVLVSAVSQNKIAYTPELLGRLNQWVSQSPRSSMAYVTRSYFTQAYLWEDMALEVGKRPKNCPPTPADLERLGISATDASIALSLDGQNPLALLSKLRLGKLGVLDNNEAAFEAAFKALTKVSPHSFQAHLEKASYLLTQDPSGSGAEALAFLRKEAAQAPADSALPILVPLMHVNIANRRIDYRQYLSQPHVWQEIQSGSKQVITQLPEAASYSALFADIATKTGHRQTARRYQQIAMNRSASYPTGQAWPKMMTSISQQQNLANENLANDSGEDA